ncbi:MAG: ribosome maturation factor RimP [Synergistaceae bacterium]|nr:ribosome maturation factor RimP [Synergistaceae bacterium]
MTDYFTHNIEQIITRLGYECVHVGIRTDFGRMKVQILIDTLGGINVEDCELVSGHVNKFLDDNSDMPELDKGRYYLEVSSPGLERPLYKLTDYDRFTGKEVRVRLSELLEGRKTFTGIIQGVEDDSVILRCEDEDEDRNIPFEIIKGGNLVYRFENENESHKEHKRKKKTKKRGNK